MGSGLTLDPWIAKAIILAGSIAMVIIRAPHGQRSRGIRVVKSRKGALEVGLLTFAVLGFLLTLVWVATPVLDIAGYPLRPAAFFTGVLFMAIGLWLFHRSHADLGTNWSITLEVREEHRLVSHGIYRHVRHPMYSALLLYSLGQTLALPNWLAGPSYLVAMVLLVALRVTPEERMMLEEFGKDYEAYMGRTKRLVPGVW